MTPTPHLNRVGHHPLVTGRIFEMILLTKASRILFASLLAVLLLGSLPVPAEAGSPTPLQLARRGSDNGGISLNEAVRQVQRETGGRVLSADTHRQGGRTVHRIKVLTPSGHVRVYNVDAQSGAGR